MVAKKSPPKKKAAKKKSLGPPINPHLMGAGYSGHALETTKTKKGKWSFRKAKKEHQRMGRKIQELTGEKNVDKIRHFMGSSPHGRILGHYKDKPAAMRVLWNRFCTGGYDPIKFCEGKEENVGKTIKEAYLELKRLGEDVEPFLQDLLDKGVPEEEVEKLITEDWLMKEHASNILQAIVDEKPHDTKQALHDALTGKLEGALDSYKVALAQSMFNGGGGGGDPDEDDDEDEKEDKKKHDDDRADDDGMPVVPHKDDGDDKEVLNFEDVEQVDEMSAGKKRDYAKAAVARLASKSTEVGAIKQKVSGKRGQGRSVFYNTKSRKADAAAAQSQVTKRTKGLAMVANSMRKKTSRKYGKAH